MRPSAAGAIAGIAFAAVAALAPATAAVQPGEERGISKTVSRAALPGGLVLTVEPGSIAVERGALRAPLSVLGRAALPRALKGVDVDDGGHVIATITDSCDKDHAVTLTIAELNARLDDVAAEAAAAAQLKARNPAAAVQTLTPLLTRAPIATYARVATEPALAPLTRRPELAKLRAAPPGTVKLAVGKGDVTMIGKGKTQVALAVSSRHRLVAAIAGPRSRGNCAGDADLLLLDQTGGEVTRLPLYTVAELSPEDGSCPFTRPARPKIAARAAAAQRLLADLGFSPATGEAGTNLPLGAKFPRGELQLLLGPDRVRIMHGDSELGSAASPGGAQIDAATYLPDVAVVVLRWRSEQKSCAGFEPSGILVIPLRAAP